VLNTSGASEREPLATGIYVSRNTYVKPGVTDWDNLNPVHLVCYYRYYRFFSNGEFLCKTSPHKLAHVHKTFKSRYLAAKDSAMFHGG
jgi:F-box protein 9